MKILESIFLFLFFLWMLPILIVASIVNKENIRSNIKELWHKLM